MNTAEREQLLWELRTLRDTLPKAGTVPKLNERLRTMQNVGAYMLRSGRLDAIIAELESR